MNGRGVVYSCTEGSIMGCPELKRIEFGYIGETLIRNLADG